MLQARAASNIYCVFAIIDLLYCSILFVNGTSKTLLFTVSLVVYLLQLLTFGIYFAPLNDHNLRRSDGGMFLRISHLDATWASRTTPQPNLHNVLHH